MPRPELDPDQIQQLEATVFAARNFVRPSDDLRPRTLELAKESSRWQTHANRLACGVLCILFVWSAAVAGSRGVAVFRDRLVGPFPAEIEQAAQNYSAANPYQRGWGMVDAFREARTIEGHSLRSAENIVPSQ